MPINLDEIKIVKLSKIHDTSKFDCGDADINDFLQNDALKYQEKGIAVTHLCIYSDEIIGFYCCSADSIKLGDEEREKEGLTSKRSVTEIPAMKIGRLGVDKKYAKQGVGSRIIKLAFGSARIMAESIALKYITIDAYSSKVKWYENRGFVINGHSKYKKKQSSNVSMRFVLSNF